MAISLQDSTGTRVRFDGDIVSIGRDSSCDFSMPHEQRLHPRHAILRKMAGRWLVETAGDWNVQVGSGPAGRKCWVKPNDVIHLTEAGPDLVFQTIVATDESKPAAEPVPTLGGHTATSTVADWHYTKGGERRGPVNGEQLRQLAASGQLQPTDLVWRDGMAEWQKASSVKGLFQPQTSGPTEPPPIPQSNRERPIDGSSSPVERCGQSQPSHFRENEVVIKEGRANLQRGIEAVGGKLYLTDRRLVFESHKFNVQSAPLQIELGSVVDVRKCWTRLYGIIPSVPNSIAVTTKDGTIHRFVVWGRESWISAIGRQTPAVSLCPPLPIAEPPQTSGSTEPHPIPQSQPLHKADPAAVPAAPAAGESEKHGLLAALSDVGQAAKTAAVVAAKKTERTKITSIDLPKAHAALGRDVHGRGAYREEFSDLYRQIDDHLARLRNLEGDSSKQAHPPATFADKAKAAAVATKQTIEAQAVQLQLSRLMSKLGETVYERHGTAAGSPETIGPIATALSRASTLVAEVEEQRQAAGGRFITRRRVVVAAVVAFIGIAILVPAIESAREASRKGKIASGKSPTKTDDAEDAELTLKDGPIPIDSYFKRCERGIWSKRTTPPDGLDPAETPIKFVLAHMRQYKPPYRIHMRTERSEVWGTNRFRERYVGLLQAEEDRKVVGMVCVCNWEEPESVRESYTTIELECLPGVDLPSIVAKKQGEILVGGIHEPFGKAAIDISVWKRDLRIVVSVMPEKSTSQDVAPTRDQMIQSTAYMTLAACVWGDEQADGANQVEHIKRKWLEMTPERFHAYFVATAKNLGAGKNANSRFLLALEPRQVRKTFEDGTTGILLDYGADTKVTFLRAAGKDVYSMVDASITGVEYGVSKPTFITPPPALRQTSK